MHLRRAVVAAGFAAVGLLVTVTTPALGLHAPFLLPIASVMLSAWYAGFVAGLGTCTLLVAGLNYYLLEPRYELGIRSGDDLVRLAMFTLVGIALSLIVERGRRTAATLTATLWNIEDGVIVTDRQARVTFLNPVAQRLTGWSPADASGRPVAEVYRLLDERSREPVTSRIEGMLRDSILREGTILGPSRERLLLARDGSERPIIDSGASVVDQRGGRLGAVIVFRDISEQRAARDAAERANRLKDEFLATLSHELRTPLNAVLGWTKMLRSGSMPAGGAQRAIEAVHRNAAALASLVSDLLDVSRIVTGRLRLQPVTTDVAELVRESAEAMGAALAAKQIRLALEIEAVPCLVVDPDRLRQVVWNLLSNAIKFTPAYGEVRVELRRVADVVQLTVSDTGQGIDPSMVPFVFDRFWQADSAASRNVGGLGLGLAIVRHLIEAHAGTVSAHSGGLGQGATFTVSLPCAAPATAAQRPTGPLVREADLHGLEGLQVLAVDDEMDSLELIAETLRRRGAVVRTAESADAALRLLAEAPVQLVVSDIGMPGTDGYALLRELRAMPAGAAIPAVALTAYAGDAHRRAALDAGFNEHIEKPVDPDRLATVVAELATRQAHPS